MQMAEAVQQRYNNIRVLMCLNQGQQVLSAILSIKWRHLSTILHIVTQLNNTLTLLDIPSLPRNVCVKNVAAAVPIMPGCITVCILHAMLRSVAEIHTQKVNGSRTNP